MSEVFESYENDYTKFRNQFKTEFSSYQRLLDGQKNTSLEKMRKHLYDAEQMIKLMEREAQAKKSGQSYITLARKYRAEYDESRRRLMLEEENFGNLQQKQALFSDRSQSGSGFESLDIRDRLVNTNEKAYTQNIQLQDGLRTANEAEGIINNVAVKLRGQRDVISHGVNEAKGLNRELHVTQKTEEAIITQDRWYRCTLYMIALILFITNIAVLIFKITR